MRLGLLSIPFALAAILLWLRGPDWRLVGDTFTVVRWRWVFAAIGLNLASVVTRVIAWDTAVKQAMAPPHPRFRSVLSAFGVGLFANAVLPGRIGELARVAVLARRLPGREGIWATLVGSVFAHRIYDLIPAIVLIVWVLLTAKIPHWAITSLAAVACVGFILFALALANARLHHRSTLEGLGRARLLVTRARHGLGVMRRPLPALTAALFQLSGWICQLLAVWTAMFAFHIHEPLPAAGLVLLLMNVATIFPLWPGNVGLLQAAVALPLVSYGVAYYRGFAYGIGLQAIEASVGIGIGLLFLVREGLSYAMLRSMPQATETEEKHVESELPEHAGAGVS
ncbi:MAG TPA: lysylphosphatidylglycerol synthase transmembrane domain-containing protein [Solirubrobacteraceae bacterium]